MFPIRVQKNTSYGKSIFCYLENSLTSKDIMMHVILCELKEKNPS